MAGLFLLSFNSSGSVFAGETALPEHPQAPAGLEAPPFVMALQMKYLRVGEFHIYYGTHLEPAREKLTSAFQQLAELADKIEADNSRFVGRLEEMVDEVNRMVGGEPDAQFRHLQGTMITAFLEMAPKMSTAVNIFYFVNPTDAKQYLREGGEIPNARYDFASDQILTDNQIKLGGSGTLHVAASEPSAPPPASAFATFQPAAGYSAVSVTKAAEEFAEIEESLNRFRKTLFEIPVIGVALHEAVELSIVHRLPKPLDPFWRCFSDGFANALTEILLHGLGETGLAKQFADGHAIEEYSDLRSVIQLRWWAAIGSAAFVETDLEAEKRRTLARYAFATAEARRLIDAHGSDVLRKALDRIANSTSEDGSPRSSDRLLKALEEITGDNLEARFHSYQNFDTLQEGNQQHTRLLNRAIIDRDGEAALIATLRLLELEVAEGVQNWTRRKINAASYLIALSRTDEALGVWKGLLEGAAEANLDPQNLWKLKQVFILNCWMANHPMEADEIADEMLATRPDDPFALSIRMSQLSRAGDFAKAKEIAEELVQPSVFPPVQSIAAFCLAGFYAQGQGVPKDSDQAWSWLLRAANARHPVARSIFGAEADLIEGGQHAEGLALEWLETAANAGLERAERYIARIRGLGGR